MERKLNIQAVLADGCALGFRNIINLLLMVLLYLITFWIPYLNVGTTIGFYKNIVALSYGEEVSPLSIFSRQNYRHLGDFFILMGIQTAGITAAAAFLLIPAFVMSLAWQFAMLIFVDKNVAPLKALNVSFQATRGEKWALFLVYLILYFAVILVSGLLGIIPVVGPYLAVIAALASVAIILGIEATLYRYFREKAENMPA